MKLLERRYDVHGTPLRIRAESEVQIAALAALLAPFAMGDSGDNDAILLDLRYGEASPPDGCLRCTWSGRLANGAEAAWYAGNDLRRIDLPGRACATADLAARQAKLRLRPGEEPAAEFGCLLPILCAFFAQDGHFAVHAAALAFGNSQRGLILAGPSGRGKTTAALALAKTGMQLLADDVCFISHMSTTDPPESLWMWGLPRYCKIHDNTVALMEDLADLPSTPSIDPRERRIAMADLPGAVVTPRRVQPAAVVFLAERNNDTHRLTPLPAAEALARLTRENVRAVDTRRDGPAGRAFAAMAALVRQTQTWELSVGGDLGALADALGAMEAPRA